MNPYDYAWAYVDALAGDPNTAVMDFRALHDTDKSLPGHARRGTLPEWWEWLSGMNAQGFGCFTTPAMMDGIGRELANVAAIRAHYVDHDAVSAQADYERAAQSLPSPCFAVASSPGKYHTYWPIRPMYHDNDRFTVLQRKLRQVFNGDRAVIDATRVMRLPGTINWKYGSPGHLVTCHALPGYQRPTTVETLELAYAAVNVIDGGSGERKELGDVSLAAPSLEWISYALTLVDPNQLARDEWISLTAAIKQAGWTLTDELSLRGIWDAWCARYEKNDAAENDKQWKSLRTTELGWPSLVRRVPSLQAAVAFQGKSVTIPVAAGDLKSSPSQPAATTPPMPAPPPLDCSGEMLTHLECAEWFKGCTFVTCMGSILVPDGRFLGATQFNGAFGGKKFIIDSNGKQTNEPWQAALRSTMYQIPKVDHIRFLPHMEHGAIALDALGRKGVNMYKPAIIEQREGDPSPFLNHVAALIPDTNDQRILLDYVAHNIKYPGYKIPWAPVIQSVEGAGKGVMKTLMTHAMGAPYVHFPNAQELTSSGSKFNAWLRNKLFILADEIKVDDKRDLIEVLKPIISETKIEVQAKGIDQDLEDNYANWMAFSNYKDAVPINKNGRRYAIFYSPLQTEADLIARGMGEEYFNALYHWLNDGGAAIVTNYFMNYPIERGAIPMRAPKTTSWNEALRVSRTPVERVIIEAIEEGLPGFRGGWISTVAALNRVKALGATRSHVSANAVAAIAESLGYVDSGKAPRPYFAEDVGQRTVLYHHGGVGDVALFGPTQGYE